MPTEWRGNTAVFGVIWSGITFLLVPVVVLWANRDKKKLWGRLWDFLHGFGCDFAMWVLILELRVLSDSWPFRVFISTDAAIGCSGAPVLICHGRYAAECKMITNKQ